ncbi:MAG: hypothetical protein AAGH89_19475, partial [Verrucomicrobiota bacterium]
PIEFYINAFEKALETNQAACLCGILAAEASGLPESVRDALAEFTLRNIDWLERAMKVEHPEWQADEIKDTASLIFSALEGAIVFAAMTDNPAHLKRVGERLQKLVE